MAVRRVTQILDGYFTLDPSRLVSGTDRKGVTLKAAMRPLVIETDGDVVLVDTGMPVVPGAVAHLHDRLGEPGLVAELARLGLATDDVTALVVTHLHYDHVGNADLFPEADAVVQADHLAFAEDAPDPWSVGFSGETWRDVAWETVDGEATVADGVRVVPTPGHVPGHQSVLVDAPDGPLVFPGDAAPLARNLEEDRLPGIAHDEDDARRSLKRLKRWWNDGAAFAFYHAPVPVGER